jgi:hypothetical protein
MPAFSLECAPRRLTPTLRSTFDAPLPLPRIVEAHSFGSGLEPRYIVRAGSLDQ